jgi:hypothetical protein
MSEKLLLPTEKRMPKAVNPGMLLFYAVPKAGKTTIAAQLPNSLLVELEPRGADFVEANVMEARSPKEFEAICNAIIEQGCPYDYVIYDTTTKLDEWSEIVGTLDYMGKAQGAKFNVVPGTVQKFKPNDPRFETVHELPNGNGYKYSRDQMSDWYNLMAKTAKHVILIAHVKDKFIESKKSGDTVETSDINLTGKVKSTYCSRADAVGHFFRRGNEGILNFTNENSVACGGRCNHLNGEIVISNRNEDGSVTTFWDRVYLPE